MLCQSISFIVKCSFFFFFLRMQKNIDFLRRNTLEKPPQGIKIKGHFFLLAKMIRKAAQSVVVSWL